MVAAINMTHAITSKLRGGRSWPSECWDLLGMVLLPIVVWLGLALPPMHAMQFTDAYFYFAYAQNFFELVERYGLNYYAVRFGAIFPDWIFSRLFGPVGGFLVLREVLSAAVCLALYGFFRERYGRVAGWLAALTWMLNPGVLILMLTPYVSSTAVPMAFLGLLLLFPPSLEANESRRAFRIGKATLAGGLFAMASTSNLFAGFIIGSGGIAWLILSWGRPLRNLFEQVLTAGFGFCAVIGMAMLAYGWLFDMPWILTPTVETILSLNSGGAEHWARPITAWMKDSPHNFAPIVLLAVGSALWMRVRSRVILAWLVFLGGMVALYWFLDIFRGGYSLAFGIYFVFLLPAFVLLFATCLVEAPKVFRVPSRRGLWLAGGLLLILAAIYFAYFPAWRFRPDVLAGIVVFGLAASLLVVSRRAGAGFIFVTSLILALVAVSGWYNYSRWRKESSLDASLLGMELSRLVPPVEEDYRRVAFWYPDREPRTLQMAQSAQLDSFSRLRSDEGHAFPEISRDVLTAFDDLQTARVIVLDFAGESEVDAALQAVTDAGRSYHVIKREVITSGDTHIDVAVMQPIIELESEFQPLNGVWSAEDGAEVFRESEGTEFQTSTQLWSNEIRAAFKPVGPFPDEKVLRVRLRVSSGRINILVYQRGRPATVMAMTTVPRTAEPIDVLLPVPAGSQVLRLVIRNDWVRGCPSRGRVERIEIGDMRQEVVNRGM